MRGGGLGCGRRLFLLLSGLLGAALLLGSLSLGLLLGLHREHLLQRSDGMSGSDPVKDHIQLFLGENLGIGLGLFTIFGENLRNLLGGHTEIRGDLPQAILH